jgi:N-acetylmuramoyl-L-alanine amidase
MRETSATLAPVLIIFMIALAPANAGPLSSTAPTPSEQTTAAGRLVAGARQGRVDAPRVELAARLAMAGFRDTPEFTAMRDDAARELAGRSDGDRTVTTSELVAADDAIGRQIARLQNKAQQPQTLAEIARLPGRPQVPGLQILYIHPLGDPALANRWRNILAHQTEGPPGSARALALQQAANPTKRGVTLWVDTDGTVYWATAENAIPTHGDGANRNDNKYIDNSKTYHAVVKTNTIGVEFAGNYPDVRTPVTAKQMEAWLILVRFLQERYGIPPDHIFAHDWIDFKDARYCEGCDLASAARKQGYMPTWVNPEAK